MCEKDLDAIFHNHDKYYYENPKHKFFKIPGTAVYRKIGRRQMQFNLDIINEHHSSIDNLPYKCSNIVDSKKRINFLLNKSQLFLQINLSMEFSFNIVLVIKIFKKI